MMNAATLEKTVAMVKQSGRRAPSASAPHAAKAHAFTLPAKTHEKLSEGLWRAKAVVDLLTWIFLDAGEESFEAKDLLGMVRCAKSLLGEVGELSQDIIPQTSEFSSRLFEASSLINVIETFETAWKFKFEKFQSRYDAYFDAALHSMDLASRALDLIPAIGKGDDA